MDFRPTFKNTDEINSIAESFLEKYHNSFLIPIPIEDEAIGDILAPKFEVSNETMRIRLQKDKLIV